MAEKMYRVLEEQRYTGKHRVYYGKGEMGREKGDIFPESELFGNKENIEMALNGADDITDNLPKRDEDGKIMKDEKTKKVIPGKEFVAIKGKAPKIELIKAPEKKGKKKKEDEKK